MELDNSRPPEIPEGNQTPPAPPPKPAPLVFTLAIDRITGQFSVADTIQKESAFEDLTKLSEALGIMSERLKGVLLDMAKEIGKREAREAIIAEEARKVRERQAKNRRRNGKAKHEAPLVLVAGEGGGI